MKKKISVLIVTLCIVCLSIIFCACQNDGGELPSGQPAVSGNDSSNISGNGSSTGEIGSISGGEKLPSGSLIINNSYVPPVEDDKNIDYSSAFIIEDNVVKGMTEYGQLLSRLVIPSGITAIGDYAFFQDSSFDSKLRSVELPEGILSIGEGAFQGNPFLERINLPNSLNSIGASAFSVCLSLTELTIPSSVASIGKGAFYDCVSLILKFEDGKINPSIKDALVFSSDLNYEYDIPVVLNCKNNKIAEDGYIYVMANNGIQYALKDGKAKVSGHSFVSKSLTIATNIVYDSKLYKVTELDDYAFFGACEITSVDIPDDVTRIGAMSFTFCFKITDIELPKNLTFIGESAFSECYGLSSIIIPISVDTMEREAFSSYSGNTIYCEIDSQPSGWDSDWKENNTQVVWGYKK